MEYVMTARVRNMPTIDSAHRAHNARIGRHDACSRGVHGGEHGADEQCDGRRQATLAS